AVEDDDLAGGREMRQIALDVHLRLLAVRWRRQGDDAEDTGAAPLRDRPDRPAFSGGVAPFEDEHYALPCSLHPFLHLAKLGLQPAQLLLVLLAPQLAAWRRIGLASSSRRHDAVPLRAVPLRFAGRPFRLDCRFSRCRLVLVLLSHATS